MEPEPAEGEAVGALVQNYDLMLHYLIGHMRRADGAYPPRADGTPLFDIFAGSGKHRLFTCASHLSCMELLLKHFEFQVRPAAVQPYLRLVVLLHDS